MSAVYSKLKLKITYIIMGIIGSRVTQRNCTTAATILLVGIEGAGKTTMAYVTSPYSDTAWDKLMNLRNIAPTNGYNLKLEDITYKGYTFDVFDVGGKEHTRNGRLQSWSFNGKFLQGMMFVVDSADVERLPEAREFLQQILTASRFSRIPVLIIANKQDLPGALEPRELAKRLSLSSFERDLPVLGVSAIRATGLFEAFRKMRNMIKVYDKRIEKCLLAQLKIVQ